MSLLFDRRLMDRPTCRRHRVAGVPQMPARPSQHRKEPTMSRRHKWEKHDRHHATCIRCGTKRLYLPDPYGPRWYTEWRLPDGRYVYSVDSPTPPCEPAQEENP